jgi:hypothetical protein
VKQGETGCDPVKLEHWDSGMISTQKGNARFLSSLKKRIIYIYIYIYIFYPNFVVSNW